MAISHAQPLLLLLLVSLFVLPALGVKIYKCNSGRQYPVDVKTVKISPDPVKRTGNANITIAGYTSIDIPDGVSVLLSLSLPMLPGTPKHYSLCDVTACPVAPGPIVLTFSNIFNPVEIKARAYYISVSISEENLTEPLMCITFVCPITKGFASLLS